MKKLKITFYAVIAIVIAAVLFISLLDNHGYRDAVQQCRNSRISSGQNTDFDFVSRGVKRGMAIQQVKEKMAGFDKGGDLAKYVSGDRDFEEPYFANFFYNYRSNPFAKFGVHEDQNYISEIYTIYFDADEKAVRMRYETFQKARGYQKINVDLENQKLSESPKISW